jgi:hypothetical protein
MDEQHPCACMRSAASPLLDLAKGESEAVAPAIVEEMA